MIYAALLDTSSYSWAAYADTEKLALKALRQGWLVHKRACESAGYPVRIKTADIINDANIIQIPTYSSPTGRHVRPVCFQDYDIIWEAPECEA